MNSIDMANKIVDSSPNLFWDGWDIVHIKENPNGYYQKNGLFKDGKWFTKNIYKLENDGWSIPNNILKGINV